MSALKCKDCRHYEPAPTNVFFHGSCRNPRVHRSVTNSRSADVKLDIVEAREICDREGDGIFVHFEPKTPASGAAWRECPDCTHSIAPGEVHTCQTPKDWRRQLNEHLREPKALKAAA